MTTSSGCARATSWSAQVVAASLAVFVFGLHWEALAGVLGPAPCWRIR
jgi:hypothetical protein